jgi:Zn-dependent protease
LAVLCAGPLANFLLAGGLYLCALHRASYGAYFLAAVSLCTGVYNLLPVGVLDGARIVQLLVRTEYVGRLERAQRALLTLFAAVGVGLALCAQMPTPARIAALTAPLYLLVQQAAHKA